MAKDVYDESWLRALLGLIEYQQTDDSKISYISLDNNLHVDHILPQKWSAMKEWKKDWQEKDADEWVGKIGNLTLLSGKKNIAAQNYSFDKKKSIYKSAHGGLTAFEISKTVAEKDVWSMEEVKYRHGWMMGEVEKLLRI